MSKIGAYLVKRRQKPILLAVNQSRLFCMQIYVNGEERHTDAASISSLLVELGMQGRMIAIERNLEVVPKSTYAEAILVEGDRIEIVHMIGGG